MKKTLLLTLLLISSYSLAKSKEVLDANGVDMLTADKVYTIVNLHPDEQNSRLYTVNYQLPSLLPRCTEIKVKKFSRKKFIFEVPTRGKTYTYIYHKAAAEDLKDHLKLYFGTSCDEAKVKRMSKKDQEGIKIGRPILGMTREGVLLAMGRPPKHVNPILDTYEWMYWKNKFARTAVTFNDQGIVTGIR
jgi:hypothetical protein